MLRVSRNDNFGKLQAGYLFPEVGEGHVYGCAVGCGGRPVVHTSPGKRVTTLPPRSQRVRDHHAFAARAHTCRCVLQIARRRRAHQEAHPDAQIISLGIGDTTEPLPQYIADAMAKAAAGLATREGYSG